MSDFEVPDWREDVWHSLENLANARGWQLNRDWDVVRVDTGSHGVWTRSFSRTNPTSLFTAALDLMAEVNGYVNRG